MRELPEFFAAKSRGGLTSDNLFGSTLDVTVWNFGFFEGSTKFQFIWAERCHPGIGKCGVVKVEGL